MLKVSIEEQVNAYRNKTQFELVCKYLNKTELELSDYDLIFTSSPIEIKNYLETHFEFDEIIKTKVGDNDGFYAVKQLLGKWKTYRQERNIKFDEEVVSENELWNRIIKVDFGLDI
jgi:hypothetical protein